VAVAESCVEVLANWPAFCVKRRNTSCKFLHMLLTAWAIWLKVPNTSAVSSSEAATL
jgi:hypothetical protein